MGCWGEATVASGVTAQEVWAVEPVLRRVIAARVADKLAVDDLVQDGLEHLLKARGRLAEELMVPYGVVTARNLAASYGRTAARRSELVSRAVDTAVPEGPDEALLRSEDRAAMTAALARLPEPDRLRLVAHELDEQAVAALTPAGSSEGTTRVRLARSRAKLRVEYLLALRRVELPTPQCHPTLLALAGGDRQRQRSPATGRHLLDCAMCESLSEPLVERRRGLAALIPLVMIRRLGHTAKSHPVISATAAAAAAGAVAVGVAVATAASPPPGTAQPPAPRAPVTVRTAPPTPPSPAPTLTVDGHPLPGGGIPLGRLVGRQVVARRAAVVAVVTHNGFWVGSAPAVRVWVELVGPLRPFQVTAGEHVSFQAPVVAQPPTYAASAGVGTADGQALLAAEGAHLAVPTTAIAIGP